MIKCSVCNKPIWPKNSAVLMTTIPGKYRHLTCVAAAPVNKPTPSKPSSTAPVHALPSAVVHAPPPVLVHARPSAVHAQSTQSLFENNIPMAAHVSPV